MARGESLFRQWNLLKALQAVRFGLSVDELAERLECGRRTVLRDLGVMRELFPLQAETRERGRKYWKLPDDFISDEKLPLSVTEMLSLHLGRRLLAPLAGTPLGDGLDTALVKIRSLLPAAALDHFEDLDDAYLIKNLAHCDYTGLEEIIRTLNRAVLGRRVLHIRYHSASRGELVDSKLHPYGMVLLAASLYCIGYLEAYDEVRTLKVSRLDDARLTEQHFEKPRTFSLEKHTHGSFGVFAPGPLQTIRAEFVGWARTNVRELTWHRSQRLIADDGERAEVEFELASTVEFKRWLLGFGPCAKVLAPAELAEEIAAELARACRNYQPQR